MFKLFKKFRRQEPVSPPAPLTEITAGEIAGFLWKQLEEENKACEEYYSGYLGCPHRILFGDERPTLWYKTNLETVLLESSENLKN